MTSTEELTLQLRVMPTAVRELERRYIELENCFSECAAGVFTPADLNTIDLRPGERPVW